MTNGSSLSLGSSGLITVNFLIYPDYEPGSQILQTYKIFFSLGDL